jgi:hypothetical protein
MLIQRIGEDFPNIQQKSNQWGDRYKYGTN